MPTNHQHNFSAFVKNHGTLIFIILLGTLLRVYRLGATTLWADELGVASIVIKPDLISVIKTAGQHAVAMPLDYILRWFFARVSTSDSFLRLPSVLFGVVTLPVAYVLFKKFVETKVALLALFLLSISPLQVERSQELRFYAPMIFFYILCTYLLLSAVESGDPKIWSVFTIVAIVGLLFHVYVLLSLVGGAIFIAYNWYQKQLNVVSLRLFILNSLLLIILFFIAYDTLVIHYDYDMQLDVFSPIALGIAQGMGWVTPFVGSQNPILLLGILFPVLGGIAVAKQFPIRTPRQARSILLLISVLLQLVLIVVADHLFEYFFAPRQLMFLAPFTVLFASQGYFYLHDIAKAKWVWITQELQIRLDRIMPFIIGLLICVSVVGLDAHYSHKHDDHLAALKSIAPGLTSDTVILVHPFYEIHSYRYYCQKHPDIKGICDQMIELKDLSLVAHEMKTGKQVVLMTHTSSNDEQAKELTRLAFKQVETHYIRQIWIKDP